MQPVGMILYDHQSDDGAKPDRQYCFDLELPADFEPVAADGEVDEFMLWPIEQVAADQCGTRLRSSSTATWSSSIF